MVQNTDGQNNISLWDQGWMVATNFFSFHIHFVMEILWRPLVAGERIGKMDGCKIWKNWFEKKHNFVISCYQLLSKVVISCYHVNSSKN